MKKRIASLLISVSLIFVAASQAAPNAFTLDEIFAKLDAGNKVFRSFEADVERTHVTVLVDDREVSSGKFYFMRRGKDPRLKIEFTKPDAQYVLVDMGKLQLYTPKLKQVQEAAVGKNQDKLESVLAIGFGQSSEELKKNYDVTLAPDEVMDGRSASVLDLKPRSKEAAGMFKSIRLWLDQKQWVTIQNKPVENGGDYFILKFTDIKLNGGISDSKFKLSLPKDVKVVTLR